MLYMCIHRWYNRDMIRENTVKGSVATPSPPTIGPPTKVRMEAVLNNDDLPLPRFRAELRRDDDARNELKDTTLFRYAKGVLPSVMVWFLRHPAMLRALADDAEQMTEDELGSLEGAIRERADAQKKWREGQAGEKPEPKPAPPKRGKR